MRLKIGEDRYDWMIESENAKNKLIFEKYGRIGIWIFFLYLVYTAFVLLILYPVSVLFSITGWLNEIENGLPISLAIYLPLTPFIVKGSKKIGTKIKDFSRRAVYFHNEIVPRVYENEARIGKKKRNCYECGEELFFYHLVLANMRPSSEPVERQEYKLRELKKIWDNDRIELLCCNCFSRVGSLSEEDEEAGINYDAE